MPAKAGASEGANVQKRGDKRRATQTLTRQAKAARDVIRGQAVEKKANDFLRRENIDKSTFQAVVEIVQHPLANLSEDCRNMLQAMLPYSIGVATNERHEIQATSVNMLQDIIVTVLAKLQERVDAESTRVASWEAKRKVLEDDLESKSSALVAAMGTAEVHQRNLADVSDDLRRKKHVLTESEAGDREAKAELTKLSASKVELETLMDGTFRKLKEGEWQEGEAKDLLKTVKQYADGLDLDESLIKALPGSLTKRERGPFDQVVVKQFETSLEAEIAKLSESIQAEEVSAAACAGATRDAKMAVDEVETVQLDIASKFAIAQEASSEAAVLVEGAKDALAESEPEFARAAASHDAKLFEMDAFRDYSVCAFSMLRDRSSAEKQDQEQDPEDQQDQLDAPHEQTDQPDPDQQDQLQQEQHDHKQRKQETDMGNHRDKEDAKKGEDNEHICEDGDVDFVVATPERHNRSHVLSSFSDRDM